MAAIEPVARHVPYHVAIGNHEYNWPGQPFNPGETHRHGPEIRAKAQCCRE